jgi:phenylpyruvate tautomerase PptA (4-oxalocrotonate tautomerase family)
VPHVIVKLWAGKSEQQKTRFAEEIDKDVMTILNYGEESVGVALEEVKSHDLGREGPQVRRSRQELASCGRRGSGGGHG